MRFIGNDNAESDLSDWWINGRLAARDRDQGATSITADHKGIRNFMLGQRNNFGSINGFMDGKLAEFIVYDRTLSDDECNFIDDYLKNKYALTSSNQF